MTENNELEDFECDQTVIIRKEFLPFVYRGNYTEKLRIPTSTTVEWYPYVNSYYSYTEDVDAFQRVNHLIATEPSAGSMTTITECIEEEMDTYSERGTQLRHLHSKPVYFLVLGKPGIGQENLGKLIASYWNCIYLDPETLINEEIEAGTRPGGCIEFNLRCGRAIGIDVILRLLEKRLKTESVKHRGAIICGFPLIQNDEYREDPVSSESAVFNVQDIFDDLLEQVETAVQQQSEAVPSTANTIEEATSEIEEPRKTTIKLPDEAEIEEEETSEAGVEVVKEVFKQLDVGSVTSNICVSGDIGTDYEQQVEFLFRQLEEQNFIIIYVMCPSRDVVAKHENYSFNWTTEEILDKQEQVLSKNIYTLFTREGGKTKEMPEDFIDTTFSVLEDDFDKSKYVTLPRDFPANVASQLERYHYAVLTAIERYVLLHDPQYFIKVDGRTTALRMFNIVKARLRILPLQKVVLPQMLNAPTEEIGGEDAEAPPAEEMTLEDAYQEFRKKRTPAPVFRWSLSDWGFKCPVSMKEGLYKDGDPKFPISFMNKIFFLSDEVACHKFLRNPRPYLLPPYPKPSCRIFIMGPPCSGKTAVAQCLAYLLDGEMISEEDAQEEYRTRRKSEFRDKVSQAAISKAMALLNKRREAEWRQNEQQRQELVKTWFAEVKDLLREYEIKLTVTDDIESFDYDTVSSFPVRLAVHLTGMMSQTDVSRRTLQEIVVDLHDHNITCTDDYKLCQDMQENEELLMQYLPEELKQKESSFTPATVFDDFVQDHVKLALANAVMSRIELRTDDMADMFKQKIADVESRRGQSGGWIVDGIPPNPELFNQMSPDFLADEIFVLHDPGNEFLLRRFQTGKHLSEFDDYRNFFKDIGKMDAAWRSPSCYGSAKVQKYARMEESSDTDFLDDSSRLNEISIRKEEIEHFKKELANYEQKHEQMIDYLETKTSMGVSVLQITNKTMPILLAEVVESIDSRYRQRPAALTEDDRAQEMLDFGAVASMDEEMEGEGGEENKIDNTVFLQNRRYGDTHHYCPVSFSTHWILWKGKEEHAVKYEEKVYLCCSEDAMKNFLENPRRYLTYRTPPSSFPPPRICVVGSKGSGKTSIARSLSNNYGLYYFNYKELLLQTFDLTVNSADDNPLEGYLSSDHPLSIDAVKQMLDPLWFEDPIKTMGFALENYPLRATDVDYMEQRKYIPDLIIELYMDEKEMIARNMEILMEQWIKQMDEQRTSQEKQNKVVMDEWNEKRASRFKIMVEERRTRRYKDKLKERKSGAEDENEKPRRPYLEDLKETDEETDRSRPTTTRSQISYDSVAEQEDIQEVNAILDEEMPEPIFEDNFETEEEARERFEADLENTYTIEMDFLKQTKDYCKELQIPWLSVSANVSLRQVISQVMRLCNGFKFRNNSCFERCYDISLEVADRLLSCGYYFLSSYGRTCPVQYYEKQIPIQMFIPLEEKGQIYPVIHRYYIYFVAAKKNRDKFFEDPLKYTNQSCVIFPLLPARFAVSGPPKSGKTCLSERFSRDLGLKVISRGQAVRYVLEYLGYCQLARDMEEVLRKGWELTDKMVMQAVQAASFDPKCVTQGMIFDGFPCNEEEVKNLADIGLVPNVVIDLHVNKDKMLDFLSKDTPPRPGFALYPKEFMLHRYNCWSKLAERFNEWFEREYQVMGSQPVKTCKWGVWNAALELTMSVLSEIKHYYQHCKCDWPLRLTNMQITPLEFLERSSCYKHFCPCCLHYKNIMKTSGDPPDRTGLVQFRKFFYWICNEHIEEFLKVPESFLPPYNNYSLPKDLPQTLVFTGEPKDCYEGGICVVCYKKHQPKQYLVRGQNHYAIKYLEMIYLFDSATCLKTFSASPRDYFSVGVTKDHTKNYPLMNYKELPTLGMLEQYVSRQIVKAITNAGINRPLVVGMDATMSACITIGLFLKLNNPATPDTYLKLYQEAQRKLERRVKLPKYYLQKMKDFMNPSVRYQEPMPEFVVPEKLDVRNVVSQATVTSGGICCEEATPEIVAN